MKRQLADLQGRHAEERAARLLEAEGLQIVARRRRTRAGEIDLVARQPGLVAFAEVKWRASVAALDFAIDAWWLRRVAAAVALVSHEYATCGEDIRIDVILLAPGAAPRHIANAWQP